jgi:hypothetical protein
MLAHYHVVYFRQGQIFTYRAISKAVEIEINKTMVKPAVVCGSETWHMTGEYEKAENMGEENIKEDIWTTCRMSNMQNKN